jgi:hypothetical protein
MSVLGVGSVEADPLLPIQQNQNESLQRTSEALTCPRIFPDETYCIEVVVCTQPRAIYT